jgi:hypothetical protein
MTIAWAVVASFTLYLNSALGQGKPAAAKAEKKDEKAEKKDEKAAEKPEKKEEKKDEKAEKKEMEMPPKPGEETKKLQFLVGTFSGPGKMEAGAMKPDSPEMPTKAKQVCKWTLGNFWVACDVTDTAGTGKQAMTWMGHMLVGYDMEAKMYRSVGADNMGTAFDLNGKMEDKKFTMESARETTMMGMPVKFRFTFDFSDPKTLKFTDERSMKGGPWQLAETITFKKGG